jgi:hypothetical protein
MGSPATSADQSYGCRSRSPVESISAGNADGSGATFCQAA